MKVAIRVDASSQIGTGHVMRCLTLAGELRRKDVRIVFVCREPSGHLCDLIASEGFEVYRLGFEHLLDDESSLCTENRNTDNQPPHATWLGVDQYTDARQTIDALRDSPWNWLIVDHYALDAHWESAMRNVADKIMVIDDLADREHDCNLLLDQNYFQEPDKRYKGLLPEHCETLLGPKYALLRPEFRQARKFCRMRGNGIARVLVYFGGHDLYNLTGMALEALYSPELHHFFVDAVVGPNNPHLEKIEKQVQKRPGTRLYIQPDGFTELMLRADLSIGAGGTTTWERLCLGLPTIVITTAQNQEEFIQELHNVGYLKWIGRGDDIVFEQILYSLIEMKNVFNDKNQVKLFNIVEGKGAQRVKSVLMNLR